MESAMTAEKWAEHQLVGANDREQRVARKIYHRCWIVFQCLSRLARSSRGA